MPKLAKEKQDEVVKIVRQMRSDDVGWAAIMNDARIKGLVNEVTLRRWVEGGDDKPRNKKRGAKADDAATIRDLRAENARLQALVSDILLGKVKLQRT